MFKLPKKIIAKTSVATAIICVGISSAPDATAANTLPLSYYASQSALSQGHWASIKVSNEGIHQITYDQLRELGFSDPTAVKVCGYGGASLWHDTFKVTNPDDIVATQFIHTDDGRIIFYAQADVVNSISDYYYHKTSTSSSSLKTDQYEVTTQRNHYATYGCYLLTDADVQSNAVNAPYVSEIGKTLDSHLSLSYVEDELNQPLYSSVEGGIKTMRSSVLHGENLTGKTSTEVVFDVLDYDTASKTPAQMAVSVAIGWTKYVNFSDYTVDGMEGLKIENATVDGTSLALRMGLSTSPSTTAYSTFTGYYNLSPIDAGSVPNGKYTACVALPGNTSPAPFYQAFDKGWLVYPRLNNFYSTAGGMLMFCDSVAANTAVRISGTTATTHVWDVTDNYRVRALDCRYNADTRKLSVTPGVSHSLEDGTGCARLIAFDIKDQHLPVEPIGVIPNQNLHGNNGAAMLIITTEALYDKAVELAKIHEAYDGSRVLVATQQQIFNEFSSGTPDAIAYRRIAKMLYDRNPTELMGILLYGTSVSDNRQITRQFSAEKLLVYEALPTSTVMTSAAVYPELHVGTDNYFGMLDATYTPQYMYCTPLTVPVARLPLSDASTADGVNKKIERYLNTSGKFNNYPRVLLTADDGDYNSHLNDSNNLLSDMAAINPAMTFIKAQVSLFDRPNGLAPDASKLLNDALKSGVGYFNYCGHGREDAVTDNGLLDVSTVNSLDNNVYPFAMISSCNTNIIDADGSPAIAQAMVLNPNGGMIAAVGSTRSVYQESNQKLNLAVGKSYASIGENTTIGLIYAKAVNQIIVKTNGSTSYNDRDRFNTHCYGLIGDPLIPLAKPQYTARVLRINDERVINTSTIVDVEPLTKVNIVGDISSDSDPNTPATFNGRIELRIYDGKEIVESKHNGNYDSSLEYITDYDQQYRQLTSTVATVTNGNWTADIVMPYSTYLKYKGLDDNGDETQIDAQNRIVMTAEGTISGDIKAHACGVSDRMHIVATAGEPVVAEAPVIEEYYLDSPDFRDGAMIGTDATVYAKIRLSESGLCSSDNTGEAGRLILDGGARKFTGAAAGMVLDGEGYATLTYPITDLSAGRHTLTLSVRDNIGQLATATLSFVSGKFNHRPRLEAEEVARTQAVINLGGDYDGDLDDSDLTLYISDPKGNTVLKVDNPSFPYTWDLKDSDGKDVGDGNFRAVVRGRLGSLYTYSDPLNIVVIR